MIIPPRTGAIETLIGAGGGGGEPELQPVITRTRHIAENTA
jgi:hypothetical protein